MAPVETAAFPPTVVLDTQVLLDGWLFDEPSVRPLVQALASGQLHWRHSPAMRAELALVLARPFALQRRADAPSLLPQILAHGECVVAAEAMSSGMRCRDAEDQKFIDLAVALSATWLISRDRALLDLRRRAALRGVAVLSPQAWALAWAQHQAGTAPKTQGATEVAP